MTRGWRRRHRRPCGDRSRSAADVGAPACRGSPQPQPPSWNAAARAVCLALLLLPFAGAAWPAVGVAADEPRAFGYTVGDTVQRRVVLQVPDGLLLDEDSLPPVGRKGRALELRALSRRVLGDAAGQPGVRDHELRLVYQVFVSPPEVRTFELPPLLLRFRGRPRSQLPDEDVRIDAWPLVVSPLLPVEVSPRRGLGDWQPDAPPPLIDLAPGRRRLAVYGALLALLLGLLFAVVVALPWLGRRRRPFERAWRALRAAPPLRTPGQRRDALRQLHAALNQTAGQVLFAGGVDRFVAAHPPFAPLRGELAAFFGRSQQAFFAVDEAAAGGGTADTAADGRPAVPGEATGGGGPAVGSGATRAAAGGGTVAAPDDDGAWLLAFCRRCRDIERGTA